MTRSQGIIAFFVFRRMSCCFIFVTGPILAAPPYHTFFLFCFSIFSFFLIFFSFFLYFHSFFSHSVHARSFIHFHFIHFFRFPSRTELRCLDSCTRHRLSINNFCHLLLCSNKSFIFIIFHSFFIHFSF